MVIARGAWWPNTRIPAVNKRPAAGAIYNHDATVIDRKAIILVLVENRDFSLPYLHSTPPLGNSPSESCHPVWYGKTRMVGLPEGEKILKIRLFLSTESTNVIDTRTDRQSPHDG